MPAASAWEAWRADRLAGMTATHGPASLILTHWITPGGAHQVPGVDGAWTATTDGLVGTAYGGVTLRAGDTLHIDGSDRLIGVFERDGLFALRIFDPAAKGRTSIHGIATYPYDPALCVQAHFNERPEHREIELFDGYHRVVETSGTLQFTLDGDEHRLTATRHPDRLAVVFGDETNGNETYAFRFLSTELPDATGSIMLDFNRAFLPPCAFSDQFVCPLPTPENRLSVPIRAGEKIILRS